MTSFYIFRRITIIKENFVPLKIILYPFFLETLEATTDKLTERINVLNPRVEKITTNIEVRTILTSVPWDLLYVYFDIYLYTSYR